MYNLTPCQVTRPNTTNKIVAKIKDLVYTCETIDNKTYLHAFAYIPNISSYCFSLRANENNQNKAIDLLKKAFYL